MSRPFQNEFKRILNNQARPRVPARPHGHGMFRNAFNLTMNNPPAIPPRPIPLFPGLPGARPSDRKTRERKYKPHLILNHLN